MMHIAFITIGTVYAYQSCKNPILVIAPLEHTQEIDNWHCMDVTMKPGTLICSFLFKTRPLGVKPMD